MERDGYIKVKTTYGPNEIRAQIKADILLRPKITAKDEQISVHSLPLARSISPIGWVFYWVRLLKSLSLSAKMAASVQPACLDLHFSGKLSPPPLLKQNAIFVRCVSSPNFPEPDSLTDPPDIVNTSRDQRKVVRIAWEKLVRWSRSLRAKANTDVLQRTRKVYYYLRSLSRFHLRFGVF